MIPFAANSLKKGKNNKRKNLKLNILYNPFYEFNFSPVDVIFLSHNLSDHHPVLLR
jgi:L-ascorbate metabolism protein UlaG (beta-lactamase superfamily)